MGYSGEKFSIPALPLRVFLDAMMLTTALSISVGFMWGIVSMSAVGLVDEAAMTGFLALVAPLITMVQYVAPAPVVLEATRSMSAASLSKVSFQLQAGCNILAMAYGVQIVNSTVLVSNMFGLGCQILYLTAEQLIQASGTSWLRFFVQLSAVFNSSLFVLSTSTPLHILGHGITILNIALCAVPLVRIGGILRTRVNTLSGTMISVSVANNGAWTLYGFLIQDTVLLLPSVIGYLLSIFQVMVILWCKGMLPFDLVFLQAVFRDNRPRTASGGGDDKQFKGAQEDADTEMAVLRSTGMPFQEVGYSAGALPPALSRTRRI